MPIRERVQRLWRLVVDWWRPSTNASSQPAGPRMVPTPSRPPASAAPRRDAPGPSATARARDGEPIIAGAVTVRMWIVGGRLVLATSRSEAERAVITLLPELDPDGQAAARTLLDAWRGGQAAAA